MSALTVVGDVEVVQLSHTDWRVSDARALPTDTGRILGFIERTDRGRYELVWLAEPPRWAYVDSFTDAVAAFGDPDTCAAQIYATRQVVAPKPAPKAPALIRFFRARPDDVHRML